MSSSDWYWSKCRLCPLISSTLPCIHYGVPHSKSAWIFRYSRLSYCCIHFIIPLMAVPTKLLTAKLLSVYDFSCDKCLNHLFFSKFPKLIRQTMHRYYRPSSASVFRHIVTPDFDSKTRVYHNCLILSNCRDAPWSVSTAKIVFDTSSMGQTRFTGSR